ncbi:unnamed protein product [Rotaria magnacalcarata]|uniref:Uncharacterized protein n=1 Tax=Rotaria magnacalcarata TaxID=392030 RepID=A0A816UAG4_9BILA|nr:unnamed protein product [Rotaria magnacalcarata]CAF3908273.1 unnamed protein product [Rotaria magnacalcarata]
MLHTIDDDFSQDVNLQNQKPNAESVLSSKNQNLLGIWYCDEDVTDDVFDKVRQHLYKTFIYAQIFTNQLGFNKYLAHSIIVENVFVIITGEDARNLYHIVRKRPQCRGVYEYQTILDTVSSSSAYIDIEKLFEKINDDIQHYTNIQESPSCETNEEERCHRLAMPLSLSVFNSNGSENSFRYWSKVSLEFYRFQMLTRILTKIQFDHSLSLDEMIRECRLHYCGNKNEISKIDNLKEKYSPALAIWYYTCDMCLFRMVGRAFRSQDFENIFKFRRYIIDLHGELVKEATACTPQQTKLYRGKQLSRLVLQQLKDNEGALISINGFLSTTKNQNLAIHFACADTHRHGYESVIFEVAINEPIISCPNADISALSQFGDGESEILFSFGSVWRIDSVIHSTNNSLWTVKLTFCNKLDSDLAKKFHELSDNNAFLELGMVLYELAQHSKAKEFYYRILQEKNLTNDIRSTLHYRIASINIEDHEYYQALQNLQEAEKLTPSMMTTTTSKSGPSQLLYTNSTIPSCRHILNNMGVAYYKINKCRTALEYFEKALAIEGSDSLSKAMVEDNIGMLYFSEGKYQLALEHLRNACKLAQDNSYLPKFKKHFDTVKEHVAETCT